MAELPKREQYIPIRQAEIVDLLARAPGLDAAKSAKFRSLAALLSATFHFEYHRFLEDLKGDYSPFDPDSVTHSVEPLSETERQERLDRFFERFRALMERGNFLHLDKAAIIEATKAVSDWGLNMDVDFDIFERIDVYYRGDTIGERSRRRWYRLFREESISLPLFQRLVLVVKLNHSALLPKTVDTEDVFIKLFKDIPKMDAEMLLPGARMRMPGLSRLKMGGSFVGGLVYVAYTIIKHVLTAGLALSLYFFWAPIMALAGYGYRQYYGYQTTKNAFTLQLTQSLYYQMLGTNLGVIQHLIDEAEEQEGREAILGYYHLWRHGPAEGWTEGEIDHAIEADLKKRWAVDVDFEIGDALRKLDRLRLVTRNGDRYQAVPIDQALARLDEAWDGYFQFDEKPDAR